MSSPGGASRIDFGVLDRLAASDQGLMQDILEIFLEESTGWADGLAGEAGEALAETIHTLKSSSRAVGALDLGDFCESWELGEIEDTGPVLDELIRVKAEIRDWLAR
ncbi:MAG: Hpt domain-containing protein [Phenylobacterium sp.]|uniref:Hpt domain-containing protein n=1 Tax=Phenylobacterium sp. TaxID=1871053 RepID=UPI0025CF5553|nr:Hpt domain-containing protein [Phenylobacterium sp.]MCA3709204.1 Hpt domain-containing protein [Phenylobacterium sp.]